MYEVQAIYPRSSYIQWRRKEISMAAHQPVDCDVCCLPEATVNEYNELSWTSLQFPILWLSLFYGLVHLVVPATQDCGVPSQCQPYSIVFQFSRANLSTSYFAPCAQTTATDLVWRNKTNGCSQKRERCVDLSLQCNNQCLKGRRAYILYEEVDCWHVDCSYFFNHWNWNITNYTYLST